MTSKLNLHDENLNTKMRDIFCDFRPFYQEHTQSRNVQKSLVLNTIQRRFVRERTTVTDQIMASNNSIWKKRGYEKDKHSSLRIIIFSYFCGDHKIYDARTLFIINTYVPTQIDNQICTSQKGKTCVTFKSRLVFSMTRNGL